ncbi:MAG TPA: hypothetical protein PKC68_05140, partial [Alphaproteobacteria bacterium]|nr:hypothetical protein [Alphaproteobacteria bacterium]
MQFDQSTKLGFLTSTSLAALVAMGIGQQAMAACTEMGMGPITTTCIGVIDTGYSESAAANTTNVTVSAGATVNNEAMGMIAINLSMNQDSVTNYGTIGKSPKTKTAIQMLGGSLLENGAAGVIEAENLGLFVSGSASLTVKNDGKITAGTAISIAFTSAATIENGTNGVITANNIAGSAIFMNSAAGQTLKITNRGTITGGAMGAAISSQAGNDEVINFGTINGLISLGDGTNKIDNASTGSRIDGRITLGSGTDTVNNNGTIIGQIDMGNGINTLTNGGSIVAGVRGGTGDDTITNNNLIQGSIDLGAATTKNILTNNGTGMSGITGDILGGVNVDEITNNGNIGGSINLSGGDDKLTKTGAILQNVDLGLGNDTMDNTGAVGGNVNLGDGTNTLTNNASGGIVGNITGGTGVDTLTTRGSIAGNINLGAGNDVMIWHIGGTVNGAIDGGAIDNDTLNLTGSGGATRVINNAITNFENLRVDAGISDVWVFNNNYTFSTKTDVVDGQLRIAAGRTLTTPNVTLNGVVAGRARLSGEGTIAGNLLVTKGIVIAGNETTRTGTLTVSGNYTNIADSILDISVGPGAQQTKLAVGGNITLDGTLRLSLQLGLVKGNATYDIITYGGMRTGQFATTNLPAGNRFTQYRVDYTSKANAVQVMVNKTNYNTVGKTYNQREAGDGL